MQRKQWNAVLILLATLTSVGCASTQPTLHTSGAFTRADAERVALATIPNAAITTSEFEEEGEKLFWSFALVTPGTSDITKVEVDALNGNVLSIATTTAR